jgi:hypothetical protein
MKFLLMERTLKRRFLSKGQGSHSPTAEQKWQLEGAFLTVSAN